VYAYAGHPLFTTCNITVAQQKVPLSVGHIFPPLSGCRHAVYWRLISYA
jgi:hypothetical protein